MRLKVGQVGGLAAAAIVLAAGPSRAEPFRAAPVTLAVVDRDTGRELPQWRHGGRLFVAGRPGARYSLRVANHTDGRILAVISVDGVNVVTGETAGYGQRGYVFRPHQGYDVTGWRKSDEEVAAFGFAAQSRSYAALTGRPAEVGVIGIAVYREKAEFAPPAELAAPSPAPNIPAQLIPLPPTPAPLPPTAMAPPPPSPPPPMEAPPPEPASPASPVRAARTASQERVASLPAERLGTAHGAREASSATEVSFVRATFAPEYVWQIEYDSYANLVAAGVIPPSPPARHRPRPFPKAPVTGGYVPDPPGA
jgi:hypothetical protein